jgi:hypothetical protein
MTLKLMIAGLLAMTALTGCETANLYTPPAGQKVMLSQQTYDGFKEYLATIGSTHPGAFAVSESGRDYSYYYCGNTTCISGPSYAQQALHDCFRWGERCYVFATNDSPNFDYTVVK